jgi:hypothetical protein
MSQFERMNARSAACSTTVAPPWSRGVFSALHRLLNGGLPSVRGFAACSFLGPEMNSLMHVWSASSSTLRAALVRSSSRFGPGTDDVLCHRATVLADMH